MREIERVKLEVMAYKLAQQKWQIYYKKKVEPGAMDSKEKIKPIKKCPTNPRPFNLSRARSVPRGMTFAP